MTLPFRSFNKKFENNDDGMFTYTSTEQKRVEKMIYDIYEILVLNPHTSSNGETIEHIELIRHKHSVYLLKYLRNAPNSYSTLDASRAWMCYWAVNALRILEIELPEDIVKSLIKFLKSCEHPDGGYGGGPGQMAHLAPTYAAVMCLVSLESKEALSSIDREKLFSFLKRMKHGSGGFLMHDGGEIDMRSAYCALSCCEILNLPLDNISNGVAEWIVSCQSYEGGFGGEPYTEAHGGYTYCAVASLILLNRFCLADAESLLRWAVRRQMKFEGGFQGRTNKLVDGCYSFWQGGLFPLVGNELQEKDNGLFESRMLEEYILTASQAGNGGFRDKPDKSVDLYHTCYVLSGLSICQSYATIRDEDILGGELNRVAPINAVFNVVNSAVHFTRSYYLNL